MGITPLSILGTILMLNVFKVYPYCTHRYVTFHI